MKNYKGGRRLENERNATTIRGRFLYYYMLNLCFKVKPFFFTVCMNIKNVIWKSKIIIITSVDTLGFTRPFSFFFAWIRQNPTDRMTRRQIQSTLGVVFVQQNNVFVVNSPRQSNKSYRFLTHNYADRWSNITQPRLFCSSFWNGNAFFTLICVP